MKRLARLPLGGPARDNVHERVSEMQTSVASGDAVYNGYCPSTKVEARP